MSIDIVPYIDDFFDAQRKIWTELGGDLSTLPPDDQAAMMAKVSSIADDLSKSKPELNAAVKSMFEAAARNK